MHYTNGRIYFTFSYLSCCQHATVCYCICWLKNASGYHCMYCFFIELCVLFASRYAMCVCVLSIVSVKLWSMLINRRTVPQQNELFLLISMICTLPAAIWRYVNVKHWLSLSNWFGFLHDRDFLAPFYTKMCVMYMLILLLPFCLWVWERFIREWCNCLLCLRRGTVNSLLVHVLKLKAPFMLKWNRRHPTCDGKNNSRKISWTIPGNLCPVGFYFTLCVVEF